MIVHLPTEHPHGGGSYYYFAGKDYYEAYTWVTDASQAAAVAVSVCHLCRILLGTMGLGVRSWISP